MKKSVLLLVIGMIVIASFIFIILNDKQGYDDEYEIYEGAQITFNYSSNFNNFSEIEHLMKNEENFTIEWINENYIAFRISSLNESDVLCKIKLNDNDKYNNLSIICHHYIFHPIDLDNKDAVENQFISDKSTLNKTIPYITNFFNQHSNSEPPDISYDKIISWDGE